MTARSLPKPSSRPAFQEGELLTLTPRLLLRMLAFGVRIGGRDLPRRFVARRAGQWFAAWARWTFALPGDRFWDIRRDIIVEVAHGTPRRRTVRLMCAEATQYPIVRELGLDAIFALTATEPSEYIWSDLTAWRPRHG